MRFTVVATGQFRLCRAFGFGLAASSLTQTELSGRNDREPHLMSLDNANREPSPCRMGEGCHAENPNSHLGPQHLGGVSEGDRTARADRVSRENSRGASAMQPAVQGGTTH